MLFNRRALDGIEAGEIDLAFRRWKRPNVKAGGTLRTRAGLIGIDAVEPIAERRIDADQARRAGFASNRELLDSLRPEAGSTASAFTGSAMTRAWRFASATGSAPRNGRSSKPDSTVWIDPGKDPGRDGCSS